MTRRNVQMVVARRRGGGRGWRSLRQEAADGGSSATAARADTNALPTEPPAPPRPVDEPIPVPPEPDSIRSGDLKDDLDTLNRSGVLKPVFFDPRQLGRECRRPQRLCRRTRR